MRSLFLLLVLIVSTEVLVGQERLLAFDRLKSLPKGRFDMAFASDGQFLYVIAGQAHRRKFTNDIFTYYVRYRKWLKLRTEWPPERQAKSSAVFIPEQERIYLLGGVGELASDRASTNYEEYLLPDIYYIDTQTKRLERLGTNLHEGAKIGLASWKGKLYLFGGSIGSKDKGLRYLDSFHEFDPLQGKWKNLPNMPFAKETQGCIINGQLYTFGGFNGGTFQDVHAYDIEKQIWKKAGRFSRPIVNHVVVAWKDYAIIVGRKDKINYLAIYDTKTGRIQEFETNIRGHSRGACVMDDKLYVFGGLLYTDSNSTRDAMFELDLGFLE